MLFLISMLLGTTLLMSYAGYVFLVVDKRQEAAMLEDTDLFDALDDKSYDFCLPDEIDTYEDLRLKDPDPVDKCATPGQPERSLVAPALARPCPHLRVSDSPCCVALTVNCCCGSLWTDGRSRWRCLSAPKRTFPG